MNNLDTNKKYIYPSSNNIAVYLSEFTGETIDSNYVRTANVTPDIRNLYMLFWKAEHIKGVGCNVIVKDFLIIENETTAKDVATALYNAVLKEKIKAVI